MCTRPNSWFDETNHCDAQKQAYLCWITPDRRNCTQHTHNSSEYAQLQCRFQCHHSILMTQKCVLARHVVPQCVRTQKMNSTCHDPFDLVFVNFQDVRQATINRGHGITLSLKYVKDEEVLPLPSGCGWVYLFNKKKFQLV